MLRGNCSRKICIGWGPRVQRTVNSITCLLRRWRHRRLGAEAATRTKSMSSCRTRGLRGVTHAREVIVATNGYTTGLTPWLHRRVIPVGSYIIATEPLAAGLAKRLIPNNRVVSDTRKVVCYFRLSEDGQRVLFGGRVAASEADSAVSARPLH